jgi:hypothetical protein
VVLSLFAGGALAQDEGPEGDAPDAGLAEVRPTVLRVAVLPFEYDESPRSRIGQHVADLLSEALSLNPDWEVIEPDTVRARVRGSLPRMTALIQGDAAAQLGQEAGVDAVITGQLYSISDRFYLIAKLLGCRSRKVFGAGADASSTSNLTEVMTALAEGLDGLLAERRHALASPTPKLDSVEETFKTRVTVLRRQTEPPPVIVLAADMEEMIPAANTALRRMVQRVRRTGMSAQAPKAGDLIEWVRALHAGAARGIPEALEGRGIVLAMLLQTEVDDAEESLHVGHGLAEAIWLDALDGAELGRGRAERYALGQGREKAAAATARVLAQDIFEASLGEILERWEARHADDEQDLRAEASPAPQP